MSKGLIALAGVTAVVAASLLPGFDAAETGRIAAARAIAETPADVPVRKGDRLAIGVSDCATGCAPIAGGMLPTARWITIERRIGDSTSVLIRVPVADIAAAELVSRAFADASNQAVR